MIDWNKITDKEFEKLCYDILARSGFVNIQWLGRTGKDRGRDLIAQKVQTDLGQTWMETWLIQCKRYVSRPPSPSDLNDTLAWADAHKPDVLLIMVTNTLTADTHDWLEKMKDKKYRIQVCDAKLLETMLTDFKDIQKKYFGTRAEREISTAATIPFSSAYVYAKEIRTRGEATVVSGETYGLYALINGVFYFGSSPLWVKCKTCGLRFNSGISMDMESFKTAVLKGNIHVCPNGHSNSYDKEDYMFF